MIITVSTFTIALKAIIITVVAIAGSYFYYCYCFIAFSWDIISSCFTLDFHVLGVEYMVAITAFTELVAIIMVKEEVNIIVSKLILNFMVL